MIYGPKITRLKVQTKSKLEQRSSVDNIELGITNINKINMKTHAPETCKKNAPNMRHPRAAPGPRARPFGPIPGACLEHVVFMFFLCLFHVYFMCFAHFQESHYIWPLHTYQTF